MGRRVVERHVTREVHRLQPIARLAVHHRWEHGVSVVLQVPTLGVELFVDQVSGPDVLVAVAALHLADVAFHEMPEHLALGQEQRDAGTGVRREGEEMKVLADLAVIPLSGLLETLEVGLQFLLGRPGGAVDAGEHRVLLVAAPVGSGDVLQPEGPELAGARNMRTAAQVEEVALAVDRDVVVLQVVDDLQLVRVVPVEIFDFGLRDFLALYGQVSLDDLAHPLLDARQILVRDAPVDLDVVEEAVLYGWSDGELATRIELQYGLRHSMRGRVAQDLEPLGRVLCNDLELTAAIERGVEVYEPPVQLRHHGVASEARSDPLDHIPRFLARLYLHFFSVW